MRESMRRLEKRLDPKQFLRVHRSVFELSNYGRITLGVDVFNVTNENTVVQRQRRVTTRTFNELQENLSPRAVRLGFKYSF